MEMNNFMDKEVFEKNLIWQWSGIFNYVIVTEWTRDILLLRTTLKENPVHSSSWNEPKK